MFFYDQRSAAAQNRAPLAHVVHPGDALDKGGGGEVPLHGPEGLGGESHERKASGLAEGQKSWLVPLQIDAAHLMEGQGIQAAGLQKFREGPLQRRLGGASPAPHPQYGNGGNQAQSVPALPADGEPDVAAALRRQGRVLWRPARDGPGAVYAGGSAGENLGGNADNGLRIPHPAVLPLGPLVHGKEPPDVRGGGDHRHCAQLGGDVPGQVVGPAQVAAENGDGEAARFVHYHHRRVGGLVADMGGNGPHGNASRPHKNQGVRLGKGFRGPLRKAWRRAAARGLAV